MPAQLPRQVKHFNVYVDGESYAGRADTITLPALTFLMEDHRAGGMDGPKKLELGMEALTATIVFSDFDPRLISFIGSDNIPLVARGSVQSQGREPEPVVVNMRGMFGSTEIGAWTPGQKSLITVTGELDYFRYRQNDIEYCEIDIINMVRRINGIDQLQLHRAAIGL